MEGRSALFLGLLSVIGIAVTAQASDVSDHNQRPAFCGDNDCPKYQVVNQYEGFELRQYDASRWVTTDMEQDMFGFGMVKSFRRLFKYINGSNAEGLNIKMTVPVLINVPLKTPTVKSSMSFYISNEVENPPQPTDPEVYLENFPPFSVYVKPFGGYAVGFIYSSQAKALAKDLKAHDLDFNDAYVVRAGYNDPFTLFNRHNEVWYIATK
ncbi:heme-binding protein 2-like [Dendropsophus ebraccatus]|uniref:heme-binding protein 2-like n=1 Tax=Dendropsophus ebraccatus TaxID=150705 RepID=UPI0038311CC8